jgi:hypothetical protein
MFIKTLFLHFEPFWPHWLQSLKIVFIKTKTFVKNTEFYTDFKQLDEMQKVTLKTLVFLSSLMINNNKNKRIIKLVLFLNFFTGFEIGMKFCSF